VSTSDEGAERRGVLHLRAIASSPRAAGSEGEARAREYAATQLRNAGFTVREEEFEYSSFPGRFGTPVAGAILGFSIVLAAYVALHAVRGEFAAIILGLGLFAAFIFARAMLGDGVLDIPIMRARATNLVATRGVSEPKAWLVAHLDSKSQPIPSAVRVAGVLVLGLGVLVALVAAGLTLADQPARMVWWAALVAAAIGALPVMASVVGNASPGAVDNASGVATVLRAAEGLGKQVACGVLLPSAEELGLAGVRAWARGRTPGIAINVDGVDDGGTLVLMHSGRSQTELVALLEREAREPVKVRRMPPGLLTDSSALAEKGWKTVTVSHGSAATLRRVHTKKDSLLSMTGSAIEIVGELLIFVLEVLV
jgi:hypothetical protein